MVLENFATTLEHVLAQTRVKHVVVALIGDLLGMVKGALTNFAVRRIKKMVPAFSLPAAVAFKRVLAEGAVAPSNLSGRGMPTSRSCNIRGRHGRFERPPVWLHRNVIANVL